MAHGGRRVLALLGLLVSLSACVRLIPPSQAPAAPPVAATALFTGVAAGPQVATLGLGVADATGALAAFRASCPRLQSRPDSSGLTSPDDWKPACSAAATWPDGQALRFFESWFETARVGTGEAFVTGYFEPEIAGVRERQPGYDVPVYGLPPDLVQAQPGEAEPNPDGRMPLGRYDAGGHFVPYYSRAEIEDGALAGRGLEIGWAKDAGELFFLQIQGSGQLVAPDGTRIHIGFAGRNGQAYSGIGTLMRDRGLIGTGSGQYPGSMQGILQYLREHPVEGRALMRENRSYVFFRETGSEGPFGSLGVAVHAGDSVAADPAYVPLGAPVFLDLDRTEADGLWIAQDTGGAIKGPNRFDSFWGAGPEARRVAGGMSGRGRALILLPKGSLARLGAR